MSTFSLPAFYLIGAESEGVTKLHAAPVAEDDKLYLVERVLPTLRPLMDGAYLLGPAVILGTLARYSYILFDRAVYWCVEWDPGLLVVRFTPDGSMAWTAIRSPKPEFGGRAPVEQDIDAYDEDAPNHQYNLVFTSWDASLDEKDREFRGFVPADAQLQQLYESAMAHVDSLGEIIESKFSADRDEWAKNCIANIKDWAGEGIRLY